MQFHSTVFALAALACSAVVAFPAEPEIKFTSTEPPTTTDLNPNHVNSTVCDSMAPLHPPHVPETRDPPYVITVSTRRVPRGETVKVEVKGLADETFKGIYIQGRMSDVPVGRWLQHDNPQVALSDCPPGKENALSFVSRNSIKSLTMEWTAPADTTGDMVFLTTIVKTYGVFWIKVKSTPLQVV